MTLRLAMAPWDLQLGANVIGRLDRWFAVAHVFYVYHTEGAYFYRFANELSGGISVGYLLQMEARSHVGLQLNLSGDSKGHDWVAGQGRPQTRPTIMSSSALSSRCSGTRAHGHGRFRHSDL